MSKPQPQLSTPSNRRRAMTIKGLAAGGNRIDATGGKFGAGIIKGFAVVTRGEALGHGVWLDSKFVSQTRVAMNAIKKGLKSRFTHPGLSSDGMGKFLGRAYRAQQDGDIVRSDLHFSQVAHRAPDGNLAEYVLGLAKEDPDAFGSSIVFDPDREAEEKFFIDHGGEIRDDPYYGRMWDAAKFKSPDELNTKNLPHARLKSLYAVDIVDEPAANPSGLFGRDPIFAEADQLMLHVVGLGAAPQSRSLGVDPQRVTFFFTHFLERHGLQLVKREEPPQMSTNPAPATPPAPVAPAPSNPAPPTEQTFSAVSLAKYRQAFGDKGTDWLLAGKSFEECTQLHATETATALAAENDAMKKTHAEQLAAVTKERDDAFAKIKSLSLGGETEPASFGEHTEAPQKKLSNLPDGLARFAASIKPTPKT